MAKLGEQWRPLVHELHSDGSETVTPGAVDTMQHKGVRGRRTLLALTLLVAIALSFAAVFTTIPWPLALALLAWALFGALWISDKAEPTGAPPGR